MIAGISLFGVLGRLELLFVSTRDGFKGGQYVLENRVLHCAFLSAALVFPPVICLPFRLFVEIRHFLQNYLFSLPPIILHAFGTDGVREFIKAFHVLWV